MCNFWNFDKQFFALLFLTAFILNSCKSTSSENEVQEKGNKKYSHLEVESISKNSKHLAEKLIPDYVLTTLSHIRSKNKAPFGYIGGRKFQNRENRLPKYEMGKKVNYQEWDVHLYKKGKNRGPERLITSTNKAYFTKNHYKTFIFIHE